MTKIIEVCGANGIDFVADFVIGTDESPDLRCASYRNMSRDKRLAGAFQLIQKGFLSFAMASLPVVPDGNPN